MLFRRIILSALLLGVLTGLLMSVFQYAGVTPIIIAAEQFEVLPVTPEGVQAHSHDHGEAEAWVPNDGFERSAYTAVSNIFAAIGFSALLLSLMAQFQLQGRASLSPVKGLLWGLAGFAAVFAAPGIGMPPEIPGLEAAAIEHRQTWWMLTVLAAAVGIALISYGPVLLKVLGAGLLVVPHVFGAPHPDGPAFTHPDPEIVDALVALHQQFIVASAVSALVFWLVLGAGCAWALNRLVLAGVANTTGQPDVAGA